MCNTAYNLKAVSSSLAFLHFGCPFVVTACRHSNMSLKSGGAPPLPTPLTCKYNNLCYLKDWQNSQKFIPGKITRYMWYTLFESLHMHALCDNVIILWF